MFTFEQITINMTKNNLKQLVLLILLFVTIAATSPSCTKEDNPNNNDPISSVKKYTFNIMTDIYYWYKDVPRNINSASIKTVEAYFDTLLVDIDRWSWMMTGQQYLNSESGIVESYGISIGQPIDYYEDYSVRVRYVFPNSPMSENNVKRGYELTHINDTPVKTLVENSTFNTVYAKKNNSFTFRDNKGKSYSFSASKKVLNTRSSLKTNIYGEEEFPGLPHKVGYFHYLTFKAGMLDDIHNAMKFFKNSQIKELILDLRYNGGGDGQASSLLANYIAPASAQNKILAKKEHNDRYRSWDSEETTKTVIERIDGALDLDRLFILTTKGSASASEVILNGLDPLMHVVQVGSTTYGKPNGMYVLPFPEGNYETPQYVFLPICFFSVNSEGYGHYLDGILPDHYRPDDLYHDFGIEDDWIKSIMHYIIEGSFPPLPPKPAATFTSLPKNKITLPEERKGYGIYKTKLKRD